MNEFKQNKNNSVIQNTESEIQIYMTQVYGWMTVGLLLTAFVSWYALNSNNIVIYLATHGWFLTTLMFLELSLVIGLTFFLKKLSSELATTMFMLYSGLTGLTISLLLIVYTGISVVSTFFTTSVMFASLSFYGYTTKQNLSPIGNFLFMVLIGILTSSVINFFLNKSSISKIISYLGIFLFSALTAHDTQKLKKLGNKINQNNQESLRKYAILGALTLYLDFINLFSMSLRIFGDKK